MVGWGTLKVLAVLALIGVGAMIRKRRRRDRWQDEDEDDGGEHVDENGETR